MATTVQNIERLTFIVDRLVPLGTSRGEFNRLLAEFLKEDATVDMVALEQRIAAAEAAIT